MLFKSETVEEVVKKFEIIPKLSAKKMLLKLRNKDFLTYQHSVRVGVLSKALSQRLNVSEHFVQLVFETAILHDIGKAYVPNYILNKPAPLTEHEFEFIKKHPEDGVKILNHTIKDKFINPSDLESIKHGILYHHERPDGKGYPFHLTNESIPYIAKIISIVDAFDAMTDDRVYRKGLDVQEALTQLKKYSIHQFDLDIVNTFEHIILDDLSIT